MSEKASNRLDLTGQRFGRLLVLKYLRTTKKVARWLCQCDCGQQSETTSTSLRAGDTKSCGCLGYETKMNNLMQAQARYRKVTKGVGPLKEMLSSYRTGANSRNLAFEITLDEFEALVTKNCHYCNEPPNLRKKADKHYKDFYANGIDRVHNSIGYSIDNLVPCCYICNKAKNSLPADTFDIWVKRLIQNYKGI